MLQYRSLLGREKVQWRYAFNRYGTHVVALKLESALLSLLFAQAGETEMEDRERSRGWAVRPHAPRPGQQRSRDVPRPPRTPCCSHRFSRVCSSPPPPPLTPTPPNPRAPQQDLMYREESYDPCSVFKFGDYAVMDIDPETRQPRKDKFGLPLVRTVDGITFECTYNRLALTS